MNNQEALNHIKENSQLVTGLDNQNYHHVTLRIKNGKLFILVEYKNDAGYDVYYQEGTNNIEESLEKFNNY